MKRSVFAGALAVAMGCLAGCINLKTENEIKPIEIKPVHITVDINVKIDRALDDFFADVDNAKEKGETK